MPLIPNFMHFPQYHTTLKWLSNENDAYGNALTIQGYTNWKDER